MAILRVEIRQEGAAFDEDPNSEIARILRVLAERVQTGRTDGAVHDINGRPVCTYRTEEGDR